MTFLIWEGNDKSGKTSLIKAFNKATNFKYSNIDRFSGTSFSYANFWSRKALELSSYIEQDFKIRNDALLIYLEVPLEIAKKRFIEHNEKDLNIEDYEKLKICYEEYLSLTSLKYIRIDTSRPIEVCVQQIIDFIDYNRIINLDSEYERVEDYILKFGEKVGNTKEVKNVELHFDLDTLEYTDENYMFRSNYENVITKKFEIEKTEYDNIYYNLRNTIYLKKDYLKTQDINSRQFIYHSESCISYLQLLFRNNILTANVTFRSCNVHDNLLADLLALIMIVKRLNEEYFNSENIKFNINISSAHIFIHDENTRTNTSILPES